MTMNNSSSANKFVRLPKLIELIGGSRSWIYQEISEGRFPKPILLGKRSVAWIEQEIKDWMETRIKSSRRAEGSR